LSGRANGRANRTRVFCRIDAGLELPLLRAQPAIARGKQRVGTVSEGTVPVGAGWMLCRVCRVCRILDTLHTLHRTRFRGHGATPGMRAPSHALEGVKGVEGVERIEGVQAMEGVEGSGYLALLHCVHAWRPYPGSRPFRDAQDPGSLNGPTRRQCAGRSG
jgi:hypothetical protein